MEIMDDKVYIESQRESKFTDQMSEILKNKGKIKRAPKSKSMHEKTNELEWGVPWL